MEATRSGDSSHCCCVSFGIRVKSDELCQLIRIKSVELCQLSCSNLFVVVVDSRSLTTAYAGVQQDFIMTRTSVSNPWLAMVCKFISLPARACIRLFQPLSLCGRGSYASS